MYGHRRTDTTCETDDHLFDRGLVGKKYVFNEA